jgi:hypothetical protein
MDVSYYPAWGENGDRGEDHDNQPGPDAVRREPCALAKAVEFWEDD